jgi:predicted MPP superfamily phosphohydrolase
MTKKAVFILFILLILTYAVYHHTNTLLVTYHKIEFAPGKRKIRIAHLTDLHTKGMGKLEYQLHRQLAIELPDMIFITGDLSTPRGTLAGYKSVLAKLKAPKGVFFVNGNWEYWEPILELKYLLKEAGIVDLTNQILQVENNLWVIGFDDSEVGKPSLDILEQLPKDGTTLGLFHSPNYFDKIAGLINISFAGHSHGGQVRIPFAGHAWVPTGTGNYVQGWYQKNGSKLFVSRGIGTSIIPLRINCPPELAIVDISY